MKGISIASVFNLQVHVTHKCYVRLFLSLCVISIKNFEIKHL